MRFTKPRIVIAGQVPPPYGGQNVMIERAVAQFRGRNDCDAVHLPFFFTPDVQSARSASPAKVFELIRILWRLICIRWKGAIDLLVYPVGGPQTVPIVRDILLLPWMLLASRRVVLHFHAAGIADRRDWLGRLVRGIYREAFAAIVMTDFNKRDPAAAGIKRVLILPHRIRDEASGQLTQQDRGRGCRLLYVGHLCPDKGTPALLRGFAAVLAEHPELSVELVGECLAPWRPELLGGLLDELKIRSRVTLSGVLTGQDKARAFARADLFVFPSVAPYESFGLVLIEAMMWRLPIVATQWRGNADVLTAQPGGILFSPEPELSEAFAAALREALQEKVLWAKWGEINRRIFEQNYHDDGDPWLVNPLLSLIPPADRAAA